MTHFFTARRVVNTLCVSGALLLAAPAQAQDDEPGSTGPQPGGTTAVPLDGGASLLLAGGLAYGLRKLRRRKATPAL